MISLKKIPVQALMALATLFALGACTTARVDDFAPPRPSAAADNMGSEESSFEEPSADRQDDGSQLLLDEYPSPMEPDDRTPVSRRRDAGTEDSADSALNFDPHRAAEPDQEPAAKPIVPAFPRQYPRAADNGLHRVHFDFDSAGLSAEMRAILDANIAVLQKKSDRAIRLGGHTDERGTSEYNLGLGMRRAQSVREYLLMKGIDPARLVTVSFGEEMPIKRSSAETSYRVNRRVEFTQVKLTAMR